MRVLLISANTEQINMPVLPLGMACVAAAVQNAGHEVQTVNLMARRTDIREYLDAAVAGFGPDLIGVSVRNIDDQTMAPPHFLLDSVKPVIEAIRSLTDVPILLGGAGYSIFPQSALAYLGADLGIRGEGEQILPLLLNRLEKKAPVEDLPGVFTRRGDGGDPPNAIEHLETFPLPLPNVHLHLPEAFAGEEIWMPFQTRRGCAMDCSYCSTAAIEGRRLRKRPPEQSIDNLARFVDAGFGRFFFVDNTFNLPPAYAEAICDEIIRRSLKIEWRCIFYPRRTEERLIEKMARAGCVELSLGFESGSEKILKNLNKKFTPEAVRRVSALIKRHGIRQMGFLLLGGPGETRETVLESLEFADSLNLDSVKVTQGIRIYPHTRLAKTALAEGIIDSEDDLLHPTFHMAPGLKEWLRRTVKEWAADRPHWMV
ncbi:MAG: B12-binding domain-containing radical SAM protein [Desulfococcaceae bacterium]